MYELTANQTGYGYEVIVKQLGNSGPAFLTCFDHDYSVKSILLGGDLLEDGDQERSMIEASLDGVTWTKLCGQKRYLKLFDRLPAGNSVRVRIRINNPEGVRVKNETLRIVIFGSGLVDELIEPEIPNQGEGEGEGGNEDEVLLT